MLFVAYELNVINSIYASKILFTLLLSIHKNLDNLYNEELTNLG